MNSVLQSLNDKQVKAVTTESQYCRIIAGAGSGKTRVLTNRFVYLIDSLNHFPNQILAITFTNKAAGEIKNRIVRFLPSVNSSLLNVFTFHGFCARLLRYDIGVLNKPRSFVIIDEEDQKSIIKRILKSEGYESKSRMIKDLPGYISYQKNLGLYPEDVTIKSFDQSEREKLRLYKIYQEELERTDQLDFDDLILKALEILRNYPEIRYKWQDRFKSILIDEFQDTNNLQYSLVKLLLKPTTSLYVVGDPDQTIYTWRGAKQEILLNLEHDFPNVETIILDENYRSTSNILKCANKLIANNKKRIEKNLFTANNIGSPVVYNSYYDSYTEAREVINQIKRYVDSGEYVYKDIVIMYRANYLTLPFEKVLIANQIPYIIVGGLKFYQRKEVKDILAYLRLLISPKDNVSFERIFNIPKRGIGDTSISKLHDLAILDNMVYYDYLKQNDSCKEISPRIYNAMRGVVDLIDELKGKLETMQIGEFFPYMLEKIHYKSYLKETEENYDERYENVETLISDITDVLKKDKDMTLDQYLQNISLMSAQDELETKDCVTLMTVHTAKGLEFPIVFVTGMNDGVFPSARALEEDPREGLEEERRICYVAFTRAMKELHVSSFLIGFRGNMSGPSQFVKEAGLAEKAKTSYRSSNSDIYSYHPASETPINKPIRKPVTVTNTFATKSLNTNKAVSWKIGDRLTHITFGNGVVIGVEDELISVQFDDGNVKKLLGTHSSITKIGKDENHGA